METAKSPVFLFEKRCFINQSHGLCLWSCCWLAREASRVSAPADFGKIFLRRADDDYRANIFSISSLLTLIVSVKKELIVFANEPSLCDKVKHLAEFINQFCLQKMPEFTGQEFSEILQKIKANQ